MLIFPAIDLYEKEAVRLYKGDYDQKTVYSSDPVSVALDFKEKGASCIHIVDLEGARSGETPNLDVVLAIKQASGLFAEIGGGIRSLDVIKRYIDGGIDRVILGTAAVTDPDLLQKAISLYGEKIAVGVDIKDGFVAIKGWTESSILLCDEFMARLEGYGVSNVICTDISKDGAMEGTNRKLYAELSKEFKIKITATGGISNMDDLRALKKLDLYAAIIGKAYYSGAIDLAEAVKEAEC